MPEPVLVCGFKAFFPNDLTATCHCGKRMYFRPHLAHIQKKICQDCGLRILKANPWIVPVATQQTIDEVAQRDRASLN